MNNYEETKKRYISEKDMRAIESHSSTEEEREDKIYRLIHHRMRMEFNYRLKYNVEKNTYIDLKQ